MEAAKGKRLIKNDGAEAAKVAGGALLSAIKTVDIYDGEEGQSITLRFTFSSAERTLSKAELTDPINAITQSLAQKGMTFKAV